MSAPWASFPRRVICLEGPHSDVESVRFLRDGLLCLNPWLELNSADSGTLGERRRASHDPDLLDSTASTLCAVHLRGMRAADLGTGSTVRRAKQSISRISAVPCASWPCEARVFTNDSRFRPRVVRPSVHVS